MKRLLFLLPLAFGVFTSCSKKTNSSPQNSVDTSYHITVTIDGVKKTFNAYSYASWSSDNSSGGVFILGNSDTSDNEAHNGQFSIGVEQKANFGKPVPVGTYVDTDPDYDVAMGYGIGSPPTVTYIASSALLAEGQVNEVNHLTFTITAVDSVAITGTFSGDMFLDDLSFQRHTMTNGDFKVRFYTSGY